MDPDQPTRPLPPSQPIAAEAPPPLHPDDERAWRAHVLDRLDSLRTGLVLVGVLAVLAAAAAAYALVTAADEDDSAGEGASPARVSGIEDRIDELESRLEDRATEGDLSDIRDRQRAFSDRIEALEEEAEQGGEAAADLDEITQSLEDLQQDFTELEQRVSDLESQQGQPQP